MFKAYRKADYPYTRRRPGVQAVTVELSQFEWRVLRQLAKSWVPSGRVEECAAYELRKALRAVLLDGATETGVERSRRADSFEWDGS